MVTGGTSTCTANARLPPTKKASALAGHDLVRRNQAAEFVNAVAQAFRSNLAGEVAEDVSLMPDFQRSSASGPRKNSFTGAKRAR